MIRADMVNAVQGYAHLIPNVYGVPFRNLDPWMRFRGIFEPWAWVVRW